MSKVARALLFSVTLLSTRCTQRPDPVRSPSLTERQRAAPGPPSRAEQFERGEHAFADVTHADPAAPPDVPECDGSDAALERVAARIAHREARDLPPLTSAELSFALRAEGSPHVWPRAWTIRETQSDREVSERRSAFLTEVPREGARLCGTATAVIRPGSIVHAAVAVDALATLKAVPTRLPSGKWLEIEARLLAPAAGASVLLLGPSGPPFTVPSTFRQGRLRARAPLDRSGLWKIQVTGVLDTGPRPVLEALVSVDDEPPRAFMARSAPGEDSLPEGRPPDAVLTYLVNAARAASKLPALQRSPRLDSIAVAHAEAMRDAGRLSHDLGDGGPTRRLAEAGLDGVVFGENVAHARDARRGHRALFSSPSHRGNMLDPRFNALGIGIAQDADGLIWVCQLFADFASTGISRALR